jgi:hypothetical protein
MSTYTELKHLYVIKCMNIQVNMYADLYVSTYTHIYETYKLTYMSTYITNTCYIHSNINETYKSRYMSKHSIYDEIYEQIFIYTTCTNYPHIVTYRTGILQMAGVGIVIQLPVNSINEEPSYRYMIHPSSRANSQK